MSTCVTLHLQTRVASIVEVLSKAAIAEISQVINEGTALLRLEIARGKSENEALKTKLVRIESELQAAWAGGKRGAGTRESGVEVCSVGVRLRDETPRAERSRCEEESSLTIDRVFGKEWVSRWRGGDLTAVKEEDSPLQPVCKEEATEPAEDRLNLFPVKVESFADDSYPQRGLTIGKQSGLGSDAGEGPSTDGLEEERSSPPAMEGIEERPPTPLEVTHRYFLRGVVQSAAAGERPSIEHQYCEEESDPLHIPAEELEEHYTQSTPAEGLEEQHTQPTPAVIPEELPGPPLGMTELKSETDAQGYFHHGESVDAAKNIKTSRQTGALEKHLDFTHDGKTFSSSKFKKHLQFHTGDKTHKCAECGKSFCKRRNLNRHKHIHKGEKPHSCADCGKSFSKRDNLNRHKRVHTGEKPYSCAECGKSFCNKNYLNHHNRIHTGQNTYSCTDCGKSFTTKQSCDRHQRTHTGEKPYSCAECGKRFCKKDNLNEHKRIHKGEKPYCCADCGKSFCKKSNLIQHTRVHTGEKPYSCAYCARSFCRKDSLNLHTRVHIGENP